MGDITVYLLLDSTLLGEKPADDNDDKAVVSSSSLSSHPPTPLSSSTSTTSTFQFQSTSQILSGDATLAELMNVISSRISTATASSSLSFGDSRPDVVEKLTILDVSYHPAKVISSTVRQYTQLSGPRSKTLQSLGWYPSGKLVVLPSPPPSISSCGGDNISASGNDGGIDGGNEAEEDLLLKRFLEWQGRNVLQHEEFAYNNPNAAASKKKNNKDVGGSSSSSTDNANMSAAEAASLKRTTVGVQWTGVGGNSSHITTNGSNGCVHASSSSIMKPSEIFNAIEQHRSHHDRIQQQQAASASSSRPKPRKKRTEKERTQRLDAMLTNLSKSNASSSSSGSKKKKTTTTSAKVRGMLLKSRSEGNKKLRMEDRFHLEVVCLSDIGGNDSASSKDDGGGTTTYRFFSRQTTAGKVASTVAPNLGKYKACEFLVSHRHPHPISSSATTTGNSSSSSDGIVQREKRYRRLPNTMSLHDAHIAGWVNEFDVVVVRIYSLGDGEEGVGTGGKMLFGPSKSVLDPPDDDDNEDAMLDCDDGENGGDDRNGSDEDAGAVEMENVTLARDDDMELSQQQQQPSLKGQSPHQQLQQRIHAIFNATNETTKKKKKKAASEKVRNMLLKSKATGNARLKREDRVYLEVIFFRDDGRAMADEYDDDDVASSHSTSSSYRYFSKRDDVRRVVSACSDGINVSSSSAGASNDNGTAEAWAESSNDPKKLTEDGGAADLTPVYRAIPNEVTLAEAIRKGHVKDFGRILIRVVDGGDDDAMVGVDKIP